jgi:methylphosphotriester-DNA--protein-cysteine methyltransferase
MAYRLMQTDGKTKDSETPGRLAGNVTLKIYGRLDCARAIAALPLGYAKHRVFFADEQAAIDAGYRPCGRCMPEQYSTWKAGPNARGNYPWHSTPKHPADPSSST